MATLTSLGFSIFSRYDGSGVRRARNDLRRFTAEHQLMSENAQRLTRSIVIFGPAAIPVFAAVAKAAGQASTAFGSAAAGLGLYALAVRNAVKGNKQAEFQINRLQKAFNSFGKSSGGIIRNTLVHAINAAIIILKKLEPVVKPVARVIRRIVLEIEAFAKSQAMTKFGQWLAKAAPEAIWKLWTAAKNLGQALFILGKRLGVFDQSGFLDWLVRVTARFKEWAESPAVAKFKKFMDESGPVVAEFVKQLLRLASTIVVTLGPAGISLLKILTPILRVLADLAERFPQLVTVMWITYSVSRLLGKIWVVLRIAGFLLTPVLGLLRKLLIWLIVPTTGVSKAASLLSRAWGALRTVFLTLLWPITKLAGIFSKLLGPLSRFAPLLRMLTNPIVLATVAFGGLAFVVSLLARRFGTWVYNLFPAGISMMARTINFIRDHWRMGWEFIKLVFLRVVGFIRTKLSEWLGFWRQRFIQTRDNVRQVWDLLWQYVISKFITAFNTARRWMAVIRDVIVIAFRRVRDRATQIWNNLWSRIPTILSLAWKIVTNRLSQLRDSISQRFAAIRDAAISRIKQTRDRVLGWINNLRSAVVERFRTMRDRVLVWIINLRNGVVSRVKNIRDAVVQWFTNLRNNAISRFKSIRDAVLRWVVNLRNNVVARFKNLRDAVLRWVVNLRNTVVSRFKSVRDAVLRWVVNLRNTVVGRFKSMRDAVIRWVINLRNTVVSRFKNIRDAAIRWVVNLRNTAVSRFKSMRDAILRWVVNLRNTVVGRIKNLRDAVVRWVVNLRNTVVSRFKSIRDSVLRWIVNLRNTVVGRFKNMRDAVVRWMGNMRNTVVSRFRSMRDGILRWAVNLRNAAVSRFKNMRDAIVRWVGNLRNNVVGRFKNLRDSVVRWAVNLRNTVVSRIKNLRDSVVRWVTNLRNTAVSRTKNLRDTVVRWFTNLRNTAVSRTKNLRDTVVRWITNLRNTATSRIKGMRDRVVGWATNMRNTVSSRIKNLRDQVVNRITNLRNTVVARWNNLVSIVRNRWNATWARVRQILSQSYNFITNRISRARDHAISAFRRMRDFLTSAWGRAWNFIKRKTGEVRDFISRAIGRIRKVGEDMAWTFKWASDRIKDAWNRIKNTAKAPIRFVIESVWNNGLREMWNKAAGPLNLKQIGKVRLPKGFAGGGVVGGGYMGRKKDNTMAPVRSGEGILVPEAVKALGRGFIGGINRIANSGGVGAVRRKIGHGKGIVHDSMTGQGPQFKGGYALGGVVGDSPWSKFFNFAKDKFKRGLLAPYEAVSKPALAAVAKACGTRENVRALPYHALSYIDAAIRNIFESKDPSLQGLGSWENASKRLRAALKWAKSQHGKPYQWGGGGNPSYDCSGFIASIQRKIHGQTPGRLYTTHNFTGSSAPKGWKRNADSPFTTGVTEAGVGHMAGTLLGVNVEASGSGGVRVGKTARGTNDKLFRRRYGYMPVRKDATRGGKGGGGGNAIFTSFWDDFALMASGKRMHGKAIASSYIPLGSKIRVTIGGKSETGVVDDLGPAKFVYDRHKGKAVLDLAEPMMQRLTGRRQNTVSGKFQILSVGKGRTLYGKRLRGYMDGGAMAPGELAIVGERGPELFRAGGAGGTVYPSGSTGGCSGCVHVDKIEINGVHSKDKRAFQDAVITALSEGKRKAKSR